MTYQLIIIGGGASGLAAAVTASALGVERIAVLEKLPRTGKKILATGNGRCNLSHTDISEKDYYGSYPVKQILESFGEAPAFFENLGLFCRADDAGRLYPYSMAASAVLDALRLHLDGVEELCGQEVTHLEQNGKLWTVQTADSTFQAEHVIFSAGGYAAPKLGTDGSAWKLLESLEIPVVSPRPVLCPVLSDVKLLRPLKGLRVKGSVTLFDQKHSVRTEAGEIQFTEKALSGICLFDLSGQINSCRIKEFSLSVNCVPNETTEDTLSHLYTCQAVRMDAVCEDMLTGIVQKPFGRALLKSCGIPADFPCSQLTGDQLFRLAERMHDFRFPVTGLGDFTQAQATAGGVHGNALDAQLQVRSHPGLYATGEAVDVHADCGGYHLHWCWASGVTAASAAAEKIVKGKCT